MTELNTFDTWKKLSGFYLFSNTNNNNVTTVSYVVLIQFQNTTERWVERDRVGFSLRVMSRKSLYVTSSHGFPFHLISLLLFTDSYKAFSRDQSRI